MLDGLRAPLAEAMEQLVTGRLKWPVGDCNYEILNDRISESWGWGHGRRGQESLSDLRRIMALDPHVRVLVAMGSAISSRPISALACCWIRALPSARPIGSVLLPSPGATCSMPRMFRAPPSGCGAQNDRWKLKAFLVLKTNGETQNAPIRGSVVQILYFRK